MRRTFSKLLYDEMLLNEDIVVLTADLGYKMWDDIRDKFPNRFYNTGSSEQLLISMGIGLTYQQKIPVLYSITPFLLYRPFEVLRTYVNHESIPVKLVGSGRGEDYQHDGFTHSAVDDPDIISKLDKINVYYPLDIEAVKKAFKYFIYEPYPSYINLGRQSSYVS